MRMLMTTDYFHPHRGGGTEVVVRRLAAGLAGRGHELHVATLNTRDSRPYERLDGLHVHRFQTIELTARLGTQMAFSGAFSARFGPLVRKLRPDVVIAHNTFFTTTPIAVALSRIMGIPTILTAHVASPQRLGLSGGLLAGAYDSTVGRLLARMAQRLVAVGPSVARHAQAVWGLKPEAIEVIPNGVDPCLFSPRAAARFAGPAVLFVGRLLPAKGPEAFVRAAQMILPRMPAAEFWLAGDGPLRARLERTAGGDSRIRFLGERDDIPELMRAASILVRPSLMEGLPLAVLEAMASGMAVVATDIPGNNDLIEHRRTGLLCSPGSIESLVEQISVALADAQLATELGRRARQHVVDRFDWDSAVGRYEQVARTVIDGRA